LTNSNFISKNEPEDVQIARIMRRWIDFEEFRLIYPNDESCYRYLAEIKWGNGYVCKKCNNDKACKGTKEFTKRCTKCRYTESVTAFTILHGLKFEINKAFYIVYLVVIERADLSIGALSDSIQLRRSTCWTFRKKVMNRIDSTKAKKAREAMKDWGEVAFLD
jgi:hypothetical protein